MVLTALRDSWYLVYQVAKRHGGEDGDHRDGAPAKFYSQQMKVKVLRKFKWKQQEEKSESDKMVTEIELLQILLTANESESELKEKKPWTLNEKVKRWPMIRLWFDMIRLWKEVIV